MKIGELARLTACNIETIRYYEKQGLLPEPERTEANYREYGQDHLERLSFIRKCRNLDLSQAEIGELLHYLDSPGENCEGVNQLVDSHIDHVRQRIAELTDLERQLARLRKQCTVSDLAANCSILKDLGHSPRGQEKSSPPGKIHVH